MQLKPGPCTCDAVQPDFPPDRSAEARAQFVMACLQALALEHARYKAALQRIAESDEQAHPLVRVALEALNPTAG